MNAKMLLVVVLALLLGGCAGTMKQLPDGRYLSAVTAGDTLDRSATYVQILEVTGKDENGKPILRQVAGDLTIGQTVAGDTVRGVTNGLGAAFVQRSAAVRTAQIKSDAMRQAAEASACKEGAICNSLVNVNTNDNVALAEGGKGGEGGEAVAIGTGGAGGSGGVSQAIAGSTAVSESTTDFNADIGVGTCAGCIPMD